MGERVSLALDVLFIIIASNPCVTIEEIHLPGGLVFHVKSFHKPFVFGPSHIVPNLDLVQIPQLWNVVKGENIELISTKLRVVSLRFVQPKFW